MELKILKTDTEYEAMLGSIDALMDATPGSSEEEELELLALLVEKYEEENYPINLPDPIEAIKFRMEQEGLSREDLKPFIGSQSKVSEVLNYKRPLSLAMIRSLHEGLGIPAEVLLREPGRSLDTIPPDWRDLPFNELLKRGYFPDFKGSLTEARENADSLLYNLFSVFKENKFDLIYCKRGKEDIMMNALRAWHARVIHLGLQQKLPVIYQRTVTEDFIRRIIQLSYYSKGPQMAAELLMKSGVHFIILNHLPKTYLDGACFLAPDGHPLIGLTLRHDRLDNFWFTIVHELAHLYLHLDESLRAFFDDTETPSKEQSSPEEQQADEFTRKMLIPSEIWEEVSGELLKSNDETLLIKVADRLKIHPAIVAGRVRWETKDYRRFTSLVGHGEVYIQLAEYN